MAFGGITEVSANSAGHRHDAEIGASDRRSADTGVDDIQLLVDAVSAIDPVLPRDLIEDRIRSRQGARVRVCRPRTVGRGPRFQQHHRSLRPAGRFKRGEESGSIADPLDIGEDDPDLRTMCHPYDRVRRIDVGLIAGCDPVSGPDTSLACQMKHMGAVGPALTDNSDGPRRGEAAGEYSRERRAQSGLRIERSQAVGAKETHASRPRDSPETILNRSIIRSGFGEAGRHDDRDVDASLRAVLHGPLGMCGRNGDHSDLRDCTKACKVRVTALSLDFTARWVDWIDRTVESRAQHIGEGTTRELVRIIGGADDRHRLRSKQGVKHIAGAFLRLPRCGRQLDHHSSMSLSLSDSYH